MKRIFQWIKSNSVLLGNAASLVGSTGVTSALGFVYWWFAARQFSPASVGFASAAISAMSLLGTFGMLGLGTLLVGELPRHPDQVKPLMSTTLLLVGGVGLVLGILMAVVAPFAMRNLQDLGASVGSVLLFAVGVSLTAVTLVLDEALIGLLQGGVQLWRNALFAAVKLTALYLVSIWLARATGLALYTTWTVGNGVSLLVLACIALAKGVRPDAQLLPRLRLLRTFGIDAIKHHALNMTLEAPSMLLPVLVTTMLSATMNAWFYVSWNLASIGNTIVVALTMALYAVSAAQPQVLARKMRLTLGLSFVACLLIGAVFCFATKQVLEFFGHSYADEAAWSLRILSLESFLFIIKAHYIAVSRIWGRVAPTSLVTIATGLLEVGGSALGIHLGGLTGLGIGWTCAMGIETVFMFPTVSKATFAARPAIQKIRTREELFAEDLDMLNATLEGEPVWLSDTIIQPVWAADTLVLNAITLPKRMEKNEVDRLPTIHLASLPRTPHPSLSDEATLQLKRRSPESESDNDETTLQLRRRSVGSENDNDETTLQLKRRSVRSENDSDVAQLPTLSLQDPRT